MHSPDDNLSIFGQTESSNGQQLTGFFCFVLVAKSQNLGHFEANKTTNKLHAYTGSAQAVNQNDFWSYDAAKNQWLQRQLVVNSACVVGFAINRTGYLLTDSNAKTVWAYDTDKDVWIEKKVFEGAPRSKAIRFDFGRKGYVTTGMSGTTCLDDLWEFDPTQ